MNEFKRALEAEFGTGPVEVPGLKIDRLDGRREAAPASIGLCWGDGSVSPCQDEPPPLSR